MQLIQTAIRATRVAKELSSSLNDQRTRSASTMKEKNTNGAARDHRK